MDEPPQEFIGPLFDALDIDIVIKVLSNTLFSPFFTFWIPMFYRSQGAPWTTPTIVISSAYFVILCVFWTFHRLSRVWRNGLDSLRPKRFDWGGQIVLITGGASGIGWLIATTLAVRNVTVIILDINPVEIGNYDNIEYYKCDVSNWEEVQILAKKIQEEIGHPTVIINNAGVVQGKLIVDLEPQDVKQTLGVNVFAHFGILKAFLPHMIEEKSGHVVTISSVMGLVGTAQMADYSASKAAVVKLHESLRYELDKRYMTPKIRTTLLLAGHTLTPMFSRMSLPTAWWYKFCVPSLQPHVVAKAIIAALDNQESTIIFMPFYTRLVLWLSIFPSYISDFLHWISDADYSMRGFIKVSGRREDEGELLCLSEKSKRD